MLKQSFHGGKNAIHNTAEAVDQVLHSLMVHTKSQRGRPISHLLSISNVARYCGTLG